MYVLDHQQELFPTWIVAILGQGLQIPFDSGWEQDSQIGQILQDQESSATQLEIVSAITWSELWFEQ